MMKVKRVLCTTAAVVAIVLSQGAAYSQAVVPAPPTIPDEPPAEPPPPAKPESPLRRKPAAPPQGKTAEQLVKIRMAADVPHIKPAERFFLAFVFDIEPQWHIYWKNSGASGGPTEIHVTTPTGFSVGKTLFPRPRSFNDEDGTTYGYEGQTVVFVEMQAPADLRVSQVMFPASIDWLVCKSICLKGHADRSLVMPCGNSGLPSSTNAPEPAINQFKKRLPQPLSSLSNASANFDGKILTIKLPSQGKTTGEYFPIEVPGVTHGRETVNNEGDALVMTVPVTIDPNNSLGRAMKVGGLVGLGTSQSDPCYEFEIPLAAP
jgi:DsbC/DsbD-like thiol-disulfide interchange protein